MENTLSPIDCDGEKLLVGDVVSLVTISDNLLKDLPDKDKEAIVSQKGKTFEIISFDEYGCAEIEFEYKHFDLEVTFHTIWVEPYCLKK